MKYLTTVLLATVAATASCSTIANNGNNANLRGQNTNTGYAANSETNAKPAMPVNATNLTPGNMSSTPNTMSNASMNSNMKTANANMKPMNSNMTVKPMNSNMNKKP